MKRLSAVCLLLAFVAAGYVTVRPAAAQNRSISVNVVLNTSITANILKDLGRFGPVLDTIAQLRAVHLRTREGSLAQIRALPYVIAASPDAERQGSPVDTVSVENFSDGLNTWDLDAINVTDFGAGRTVPFDGTGVCSTHGGSTSPRSGLRSSSPRRSAAAATNAAGSLRLQTPGSTTRTPTAPT